MFLFSGTWVFAVSYCCYFVAMYPCVYSEIHASFEYVQYGCFVDIVVLYPSMPLFAIMECLACLNLALLLL